MADPFKPIKQFKAQPSNKSKGILDDFAVRKNVATREGSITKTPANDNDITNKKYVDDEILNQIEDGTASGQMAFWNGTKWVKTETSELFWDDTNKRLGIGTAIPSTLLHLKSSDVRLTLTPTNNVNDPYIVFQNEGGNDRAFIYYDVDLGKLFFDTNAVNRAVVIQTLAGGKVGIGTLTPDTKLQVVGDFKSGEDTTNYFSLASNGTARPRGTATYQSNDGTAGLTQTTANVNTFDIVIKDGLITSFTKNS